MKWVLYTSAYFAVTFGLAGACIAIVGILPDNPSGDRLIAACLFGLATISAVIARFAWMISRAD